MSVVTYLHRIASLSQYLPFDTAKNLVYSSLMELKDILKHIKLNDTNNLYVKDLHILMEYRRYSILGKLPSLECPNSDGSHLSLIPKMDLSDRVRLYCLSCSFEEEPGIKTIQKLENLINSVDTGETS